MGEGTTIHEAPEATRLRRSDRERGRERSRSEQSRYTCSDSHLSMRQRLASTVGGKPAMDGEVRDISYEYSSSSRYVLVALGGVACDEGGAFGPNTLFTMPPPKPRRKPFSGVNYRFTHNLEAWIDESSSMTNQSVRTKSRRAATFRHSLRSTLCTKRPSSPLYRSSRAYQ